MHQVSEERIVSLAKKLAYNVPLEGSDRILQQQLLEDPDLERQLKYALLLIDLTDHMSHYCSCP